MSRTSRRGDGPDPSAPLRGGSLAASASDAREGGSGLAAPPALRRSGELALFLRRWLANPRKIGAIAPSAPSLARHMAHAVRTGRAQGGPVVELGPGTGAVTRALLQAGVPEDRILLVERDRHLHSWLAGRFPGVAVLHCDARQLDRIVPSGWVGRVSTVVSSLPLNSLSRRERVEIVRATFRVLANEGSLVQYSYGIASPLPCDALGLTGERTAFIVANLPPASVWRFSRAPDWAPHRLDARIPGAGRSARSKRLRRSGSMRSDESGGHRWWTPATAGRLEAGPAPRRAAVAGAAGAAGKGSC